MNIKKMGTAAAAAVLVCSLLTGCGASMKTARVATKFGNALKDQPITSATAEISTCVTASDGEKAFRAEYHTVVRSRADWDLSRSYSDVSSTIKLGDEAISQSLQSYTSGESGEDVRYVHVDSIDTWLRLQNQKRAVDIDPGLILLLLDKVSENTTMEVRETTAGGGVHYVLGLSFNAQDIMDFVSSAGLNIPEEFKDCDFKDVQIPVELEIEDKTFLPIRLQAKLQGINDSLIQALARSLAKGKAVEGLTIEMEDVSLLITNFSYGPQDIPMLPKGAAEKALDMEKVKEIQN